MRFGEELLTARRRGTNGFAIAGIGALGDVTFDVPADYETVQYAEARVRAQGSGTVVAAKLIGKPPAFNGVATCNVTALLQSLAPGDYTVSVALTNAGGTTDSAVSNAFTVPLIP